MFHAQLLLFRFAPKFAVDPYWRPNGRPSSNPYTGEGRASHAWTLSEMLQLKFEKHDFSIAAVKAFSENSETAICGGGGTAKSTSAGWYGFFFWLCAVYETTVLIASTSIDAARKRLWKNSSEFYSHASRVSGGLGESVMLGNPKPHIRSAQKDMVHGMYVIPVAQGDLQKALDALKGTHSKRILVIGDETDAISQAIVDVTSNLRIGCEEFQAIWLGNLPSLLNPLGKLMAPSEGKPVTEALGNEWVSEKGIKCLRFDGEDSPNIRDGDKWTGLVRQKDIDAIEKQAGGKNTPLYWIMVRGLPPPDGVDNIVVSESMTFKFNCYNKVIWRQSYIESAMLDPGFGGDPCVLRTMKRGLDKDGQFRVELGDRLEIPIATNQPLNPAEYQIAGVVKNFCQSRGVRPDEFIGDTTGIGRGTGAVLQREWSPNINLCEFGGAPSEMIVSEEDPRPANEVYDRRISELAFSVREFIEADMIRGMDTIMATQLCQRQWDMKGRKKSVEKKEDMKARGKASPNDADCFACGVELLRRKGINASIQTPVKSQANHDLEREVREQDFDAGETYAEDYGVAAEFY